MRANSLYALPVIYNRNLDDAYARLSAEIVELGVRDNSPDGNAGGRSSPAGILRREIEKKRRHKAIRTLMEEIPDLVTSITPSFMMSPLSIAQYLSPETELFDVVVFDEASQIPVWDAVGAIARGKQVIYGQQTVMDQLHGQLTQLRQEQQARRLVESTEVDVEVSNLSTDDHDLTGGTSPVDPGESHEELVAQNVDFVAESVKPAPLSQSLPVGKSATAMQFRFADKAEFAEVINPGEFHEIGYTSDLKAMVEYIVDQEGPVREVDLINTIRSWHGWNRSGRKIRERILQVVPSEIPTSVENDDTLLYWPTSGEPTEITPFRSADGADNQRTAQQVPMPELIGLAIKCAGRSHDHETVVRYMCDAMGIERLSASVRNRLETALDHSRQTEM